MAGDFQLLCYQEEYVLMMKLLHDGFSVFHIRRRSKVFAFMLFVLTTHNNGTLHEYDFRKHIQNIRLKVNVMRIL